MSATTPALRCRAWPRGSASRTPREYDNCLDVSSPEQRDTSQDGFGNICDGDLNNSLGLVNAADLSLFRVTFGIENADADFNGNGGIVNEQDMAILRTLFGFPPGPPALAP